MKGFFLFIVFIVFSWNSIVCVNNNVLYKLKLRSQGRMIETKDLIDNVLLITCMTISSRREEIEKKLIFLSNRFNKFGCKILVLLESSSDKTLISERKRIIAMGNENKILIIDKDNRNGNNALGFWQHLIAIIQRKFDDGLPLASRTKYFLINKGGNDIIQYSVGDEFDLESPISNLVEPWIIAKNIYEFVVYEYDGNIHQMHFYKNKVLLMIDELDDPETMQAKFQSLVKLDQTYSSKGLRIILFTFYNNTDTYPGIKNSNIKLLKMNKASEELWNYIRIPFNTVIDLNTQVNFDFLDNVPAPAAEILIDGQNKKSMKLDILSSNNEAIEGIDQYLRTLLKK